MINRSGNTVKKGSAEEKWSLSNVMTGRFEGKLVRLRN
jgi:hypothetical protein